MPASKNNFLITIVGPTAIGKTALSIQLANYFKSQAFEVVGVSPQRLGQQIGQTDTATGIEQAVSGSYAQTEMHFVEHSDHLMPRVHQMRTDLAQYYHSTKPSIRLQYMTSLDERVNFEINGTELMLRDINVFCTTKANHRAVLEQMKRLASENNTTGASIYDLGKIIQADSMGTLNSTLKGLEEKMTAKQAEERGHAEEMQRMQGEQMEKEKAMEQSHEAKESEKNRRKDILVAEIKASGFGAMQDINKNEQSDFIDNMEKIKKTENYADVTNIQQQKVNENKNQNAEKNNIKREELAVQRENKSKDLEIARENKNQYDTKPQKKDNKKS